MTICFKNESMLCVNIYIGDSHINLPYEETYTHTCFLEQTPIEIKFSIVDKENCAHNDGTCCLNISTIILCDFLNLSNPTLIITKKASRFQNYTKYQFLIINSSDLCIQNVKHEVDDYEFFKATKFYLRGQKNPISYVIKKSFIDMLLDGFLLSVILAWVFSWKVAIGALLVVFAIALIVNSIRLRTSKSKYRILNWDKDKELPDDIEYFITHLERYCN